MKCVSEVLDVARNGVSDFDVFLVAQELNNKLFELRGFL